MAARSQSQNDPGPYKSLREGDSPVPGLTLRRILRGHQKTITRIAWSPDGRWLGSSAVDGTTRIWDTHNKVVESRVIVNEDKPVEDFSWAHDGNKLVSCTETGFSVFDSQTGQLIWKQEDSLRSVSWSPEGNLIATGSNEGIVKLWNVTSRKLEAELPDHKGDVLNLAWSPDGRFLASGGGSSIGKVSDQVIRVWDVNAGSILCSLAGHTGFIADIAWSPDSTRLASVSQDNTVKVWEISSGRLISNIEAHTHNTRGVAFSPDGRILVSNSWDETLRFWRTDTFASLAVVEQEYLGAQVYSRVVFEPTGAALATVRDNIIQVWNVAISTLLGGEAVSQSVRYTTARLVLVGDSGVGKTGLGWRLAHGEFKEHASTHGQQFWVIDDLGIIRADGSECEAVLWDLAGQHIYRPIHALFLDDVNLALVLFDPTNRQEPLIGVDFWLKQLAGKRGLPPSVLVGARVDRGEAVLTRDELAQFCQHHHISGGYVSTSARTGEGVDELMAILKTQIPWSQMTTTVTTLTFKRVKDYLLSLKEQPDRKNVLISPAELRQQLQAIDTEWTFSDAEMMTAIGHLETHGYVAILRSSSGEKAILLKPDLLVNLVSSIVLQASRHLQSLGSLSETVLIRGGYDFDELIGLTRSEQEILLDVAVLRFLEHNICFRETLGVETLLIFPGLIRQKRPLYDDIETVDDVSYIVRGAVENVYSALVVLLSYTQIFTRVNQWLNQAQFEMGEGEICGFRQIEERAGEIELILYYASTTPSYVRTMFQGLFEKFLYQRDVEVTRYPPLYCANGHLQERATVIKWLRQGERFLFCSRCGQKVALPVVEEPLALGERNYQVVVRAENLAELRRRYEMHLLRVKGFRRDRVAPRCFISHLSLQASWAADLVVDLRDAGVRVVDDPAQVQEDDFILLAATPAYRQAWQSLDQSIAADIALVQSRLKGTGRKRLAVIPLLIEGDLDSTRPRDLLGVRFGDFRDESCYAVALFDLVLSLYAIPLNHPAFAPLRDDLRQQWENTLVGTEVLKQEIFISYAWGGESEEIANQLDHAFQDRGVTIVRDKRDVGFKGHIKMFMDEIGEGKCVILVISEKYLKSPNCCYELVQVARYGAFYDRIFPIILADARIYKPTDRLRYIQYWEEKREELDEMIKTVSAANLEGFREDIDLYTEIRMLLPELMNVLKNMNTLTPEIHLQSDFTELFRAVMTRLEA